MSDSKAAFVGFTEVGVEDKGARCLKNDNNWDRGHGKHQNNFEKYEGFAMDVVYFAYEACNIQWLDVLSRKTEWTSGFREGVLVT